MISPFATLRPMATRPTFADFFPQPPQPAIAMAHLPALPGTPRHKAGTSLDELVERVRTDLDHLLAGGVDAVMFCNEDDRPYRLSVGPEIPAAMAAVVAELWLRDLPFGVDVLWDPIAAMALARATGAAFMREVVTGAYESDMARIKQLGRQREKSVGASAALPISASSSGVETSWPSLTISILLAAFGWWMAVIIRSTRFST